MSNLFEQVQIARQKKSAFDLSHERKFTCNMGDLVPILCEEVLPGDVFKMNTELFMRLMPLTSPVMHRVNVFTHFFFVPYRLIWDNWQNFITGGETGNDTSVCPYVNLRDDDSNLDPGKLADYLGISVGAQTGITMEINALPFRAYQLIFDEYYRDQDLVSKISCAKNDGEQTLGEITKLMTMRKRAWEKDYFTSARPWTQKGSEVTLPMSGNAPVILNQSAVGYPIVRDDLGNPLSEQGLVTDVAGNFSTDSQTARIDPNETLVADMSQVTSTTVNQLRAALRLQQWFERNARAGSRYIEQILSHFGVRVPDHRLQRPEYLGGGKSPVVISEVLQTSSTDSTSPQGNLAGHGMSVGNTHRWQNRFSEHGLVIGIMSVLPRTAYMQGTRRHFMKNGRFQYAWPEFANLGEQEVYVSEMWTTGNTWNKLFGYQSRYSEYKYIPSSVHGEMKGSLEFWHMARKFDTEPELTDEFVESDPTSRVFAVTDPDEHHLIVQLYHSITAVRPLPYFGTPSII